MNYLSICAVVRNEAPYIKEWLDYHIKQGVEKFYLYDNESQDDVREVTKDYDCIHWYKTQGYCQQNVSYNHMILTHGAETEWCAFIDIDEFLVSTKHEKFVDSIKHYDDQIIAGIAVHWLLFGSNGQEEYSPEPVTQRFTRRAAEANNHVKSVMRMSMTLCAGTDPHSFIANGPIIDESFNEMPRHYATKPGTANILRVNHYYTKSRAEHKKRKGLPDASSGVYKDHVEQFAAHDVNDVEDLLILSRI